MSGAPAYNIFHIVAGSIGLALVSMKIEAFIRVHIGFGGIDLYQVLASFLRLFPEQVFLWKPADDVLHIVIGVGVGLIVVGLYARDKRLPH